MFKAVPTERTEPVRLVSEPRSRQDQALRQRFVQVFGSFAAAAVAASCFAAPAATAQTPAPATSMTASALSAPSSAAAPVVEAPAKIVVRVRSLNMRRLRPSAFGDWNDAVQVAGPSVELVTP